MDNKSKTVVNLGLDMGISSVGWAITDQNFRILEHGVRLFKSMDEDGELANTRRRDMRHQRRTIRRRAVLKRDFIKYLAEEGIFPYKGEINSKTIQDAKREFYNKFLKKEKKDKETILDLRLEGLKKGLETKKLIKVLYWYLGHRGFKYEVIEDESKKKEQGEIKKANMKLLKELSIDLKKEKLLPAELQKILLEKIGYYRCSINREWSSKDYEKEITKILDNSKMDEKVKGFKKKFLEFFWRQRNFEEGPGSQKIFENAKDPSKIDSEFMRFKFDKDTKKLKVYDSMWEISTGKCTLFPEEYRAPKNSLTAQVFNLLNDLNNISLSGDNSRKIKLNPEQKLECIKLSFESKTNINKIKKYICSEFNVPKEDLDGLIKGLRETKGKKHIITELGTFFSINKALEDKNKMTFDDFWDGKKFNFSKIDEIVTILSKTKILDKRIDQLSNVHLDLSKEEKEKIAKLPSFSANHSFSLKAMNKMIPILIEKPWNQMQILESPEFKKYWENVNKSIKKSKYLSKEWIKDLIISPTTKRSIIQTVNLINEILKKRKNYYIKNIVIEMARDLNSKKEKESIKHLQKWLEEKNDLIKVRLRELGILDSKNKQRLILKIWFFEQQKGLDVYTGKKIDLIDLVQNPSYCDIDHIIPYSQCFDDSRSNKVLTLKENNARKSNKTPYQFLSESEFSKMSKKWAEWYLPKNNNSDDRRGFIDKKKYEYLTDRRNFANPEIKKDFISRNIVDTRYASKMVLHSLKAFKNNSESDVIDEKTQIKTVNGKMTSFFRKKIEHNKQGKVLMRPKDIDDGSFDEKGRKKRIWNGHHAEDAYIVIHSALKNPQLNKLIEKIISNSDLSSEKRQSRGEEKLELLSGENSIDTDFIREELNSKMNDVKFSYMVTERQGLQLHNDTLYGAKEIDDQKMYKVKKHTICEMDRTSIEKIFEIGKESKYKYNIRMKTNDPKTWEALKTVIKNNINSSNKNQPLRELCDKNNNYICVEVKNTKGKIVKRCVKNIRTDEEVKQKDELIIRKENFYKNSGKGFYESLNWSEIHLYKNKKDRWQVIPITCLSKKFVKGKDDRKINLQYWINKYDLDTTKDKIVLKYGSIVMDPENNLYRVVGHSWKSNKIELKPLWKVKIDPKKEPRHYSVNTKIKNWFLVNCSYLGQIKKIKKF